MATTELKIVGLAGPKFTGKSTVASYLVKHHGFTPLHFAEPTKVMLKAVFGIDYDRLNGADKETGRDDLGGLSPRKVLQTFGSEYLRKTMGEDILVKMAGKKVRDHGNAGRFVFDDVRFNNEAIMVKSLGGCLWSIRRQLENPPHDDHISEKGIAPSFIDCELDLNGKESSSSAFASMIRHALKSASVI